MTPDERQEWIGVVYDEYAPRLYRYLYHRLGDRALAEDLTSEAFVRLLHSRLPDRLGPYLYRVAHNLFVDYMRRNPLPCEPLAESLPSDKHDPAREAERAAESVRLRLALARLTPEQAQVIVLHYLEGLSHAEIALVLDKPEGAVKALQHRGMASLRRLLGDTPPALQLEFAGQ